MLPALLVVVGPARLTAGEPAQNEVVAAAGIAGAFRGTRATQTRLEYHFRGALVWRLRPYLATGLASDGGFHAGLGIAYRQQLGEDWRMLLGSGPAIYRRRHGFDLGDDLEFFSFAEIDYRLARRHWLGLRVAHVSNGGFGNRNPGREMAGLAYSFQWGGPEHEHPGAYR